MVRASIKGADKLIKKLRQLQEASLKEINQAISESVIEMHNETKLAIQAPSQGRTYQRGSVTHVASAPGDAPNIDTGRLINSIFFDIDRGQLVGTFGTRGVDYAKHLEYGTSRMEARPFIRPTFEKHKRTAEKRIRKAILDAIRKASK